MDNKIIGNIILEGASTAEDVILKDNKNGRRVIAEGILQDMDTENRNHRIYAAADLKPEINGPRMRELIKHNQFMGEYGHPLSEDLVRQQTIDPKLVAVRFLKVWTEGKYVKAHFMGTNNDFGSYFDQDLRDGYKPAFSLRALGSIENINGKAYVKGIKIITWDSVVYPSHFSAYTSKVLSESAKESTYTNYNNINKFVNENQVVVEENDPGTIIRITNGDAKDVLNRLQKESANITTILETFNGIYDDIRLKEGNKLQMISRFGDNIEVNLEHHVSNILMDYAFKM